MQIVQVKGFKNLNDLAAYLGYASSEKLYRLKRTPSAKPSYDIVEDFTNKFEDLNTRWFVTGKGNPGLVPSKDAPIQDVFQAEVNQNSIYPDSSFKKGPSEVQPTQLAGLPQIITVDQAGRDNVVLVGAKARAGYLTGYGDPEFIQTLPAYRLPGLNNGTFRAFEVEGESMKPTLKRGEIVIAEWVESLTNIREDRVHVVVTKNDGIVIKRLLNRIDKYGFVLGKSDSVDNREDYPNLQINPSDIIELWYPRLYISPDFKAPADMYKRINDLEADISVIKKALLNKKI